MKYKILSAIGLFGLIFTAAFAPEMPFWVVLPCFSLSGFLNIYFARKADACN